MTALPHLSLVSLRRRIRPVCGVVAVASLALAGAGCSKAAEKVAEKAVESQTGASIDIDSDTSEVKVETEDGSYSTGTGKVPDSWPAEVTLPEDFVPQHDSTQETEGEVLVLVQGTTKSSPKDILDSLRDSLSGWTISGDTSVNSGNTSQTSAQWDTDGRRVTFTATNDGTSDTWLIISHTAHND